MTPSNLVRSSDEMRFWVSLQPCPSCGGRSYREEDMRLGHDAEFWTMNGSCLLCDTKFSYRFRSNDPVVVCPFFEIGGPNPSEIISPQQFVAELEVLLPQLPEDPTPLEPKAWARAHDRVYRALTCVVELLKFLPKGANEIPQALLDPQRLDEVDSRPERFQRAWLTALRERLNDIDQCYDKDTPRIVALKNAAHDPSLDPRGRLERETLIAHGEWLRRGRTGPGRLDIAHFGLNDARIGNEELMGARLEDIKLEYAFLSGVNLEEADLVDLVLTGANLKYAVFSRARIIRGSFIRAQCAIAELKGCSIRGTDFSHAQMARSDWSGAYVEGAQFERTGLWDATFDNGEFFGCSYRGATFASGKMANLCTTRRARFENCDFRDTEWKGRDLSDALFIKCQFSGARGAPSSTKDMVVLDSDVPSTAALRELLV